ncbi:MAG: YqcI/YcgG family protein, partial [Anaerolineae bacterium]|nr:YqcI/YcgG family protein [Anaerolineae bacterium]
KYLYVSFYNAMDDDDSLASLSTCFSDFATLLTRERTMEQRKYEGLMCIFKKQEEDNPAATFRDSASLFWSFLQKLNQKDPAPWPKNAHADPSSRLFRYCFAGRQWFVIYFSPLHRYRARKSDNFMVFFQPPEVFTVHIETNPNFEKVRTTIRKRVETYAGRSAMVHLAHFADSRPELMRALGPYWDGALASMAGNQSDDEAR